jgi:hypothetical protein
MLTIRPHAYDPGETAGGACAVCACPPEHPAHTYTLPGLEDTAAERAQALAEEQGRQLTARMRQPRADVTGKTREIEQHSPLFRDSAANSLGRGLF